MVDAGARCDADVSLVDIAPTVLAAAGVSAPRPGLEGRNLLDIAAAPQAQAPRDVFSQWNMTPWEQTWHGVEPWRLIVRHPWKYTLHENGEAEMFQLEEDPIEVHNRAGDPHLARVESDLKQALLHWCRRTGDVFAARRAGSAPARRGRRDGGDDRDR